MRTSPSAGIGPIECSRRKIKLKPAINLPARGGNSQAFEPLARTFSARNPQGRGIDVFPDPHILFACSKAGVHATRLQLTQSQVVVVRCIRLTNHHDPCFVVNSNCHGVTARRAQPNVFHRLGFRRESPRTVLPYRLRAPVPQKEPPFM